MGEHIMNNPEALAKMQDKLNNDDEWIRLEGRIPKAVKKRVQALRALQLKIIDFEVQFNQDFCKLEHKYSQLTTELFEKRSKIINGLVEPDENEINSAKSQYPELFAESDDESDDEKVKELTQDGKPIKDEEEEDPKCVPRFWLSFLYNLSEVAEMIQKDDEPILKHLTDIKLVLNDSPMEFQLDFHFSPNEYFTNSVLYKKYKMECQPDKVNPFTFDGPQVVSIESCKINWNHGKNPGEKQVTKKQKHAKTGSIRSVTKSVPQDSFFNFFREFPKTANNATEEDEETLDELKNADFDVALSIRDSLRRAVLIFTGEVADDEDYEDESDYEETSEDDDESDSESDSANEDVKQAPQKSSGKPQGGKGHAAKKPEECNPQ